MKTDRSWLDYIFDQITAKYSYTGKILYIIGMKQEEIILSLITLTNNGTLRWNRKPELQTPIGPGYSCRRDEIDLFLMTADRSLYFGGYNIPDAVLLYMAVSSSNVIDGFDAVVEQFFDQSDDTTNQDIKCCCRSCAGTELPQMYIVCPKCGNKRCPKAEFHNYKCTGSNETAQVPEYEPNLTSILELHPHDEFRYCPKCDNTHVKSHNCQR